MDPANGALARLVGLNRQGAPLEVKLSQLLRAMSQAADLGEAKEIGHAQRVFVLAHALAQATEAFEGGDLAELAVASLLHDIGISSVSYGLHQQVGHDARSLLTAYPSVTDRPFGRSGHDDRAIGVPLARHVDVGSRMLQQLGYGIGATLAVETHHAWYDGTGYPGELAGDSIPLAGRVLGLADHLDTATSHIETTEGRRQAAQTLLEGFGGTLVSEALAQLARTSLTSTEVWERVLFHDESEGMLDEIFAGTYGASVDDDGVEAHMRVLAQFVDAQSPFAAGHTFELARLAQRIGERIGLEPDALQELHLASLVHSAGRLGISSDIIEKGGGLTDEEFIALHTYPNLTREVMKPLTALNEVVDAASTHREKLDGSGYPEARAGDEIPLIGRILSVADTFVALVSERPYRAAYSRSRALAIVQAESARLFDGLVTDALEAVYREGL